MTKTPSAADAGKRAAALAALDDVQSGMRLGLGTGSTADWFVRLLGEACGAGRFRDVVGVPTSLRTGELAERSGLRLTTLDDAGWLDLTVDGADEVDPELNLIKGGGGALLQEKIVACASDRMIVIADASKSVDVLGAFPLPVEIVPFGWETTKALVEAVLADADVSGRETALRLARDTPFITDGGHMILDLRLGRIGAPRRLASELVAIPGVIDTGLFLGVADAAIFGREDGGTERRDAPKA
ncbi:ribose-5-phosphate isomerase RpiA [Rubrimonas cliftonensis]|uniref:Ribose-5-phosphate isomerase A n=1 Tax=Rubrimonas cliftonensis TaxID=89524 RepID=A0A1H3VWP3_9RHOB|nr:ribose-5-phosphate isomerase RpiA [Rubrimonas cliftonensis]SDZ78478.1 ribose-5-phosphate isomerase [Rubrimonas cliftonensis]